MIMPFSNEKIKRKSLLARLHQKSLFRHWSGYQDLTKCTITVRDGARLWSGKKYKCTIQQRMTSEVPSKMQRVQSLQCRVNYLAQP